MTSAAAPAQAEPGLRFWEQLHSRLEEAAAAAGGFHEHDLRIGGIGVRLRSAGRAMLDALLGPLDHLSAPADRPEVSIGLFDTVSTGVELPPLPWTPPPIEEGKRPVARLRTDRHCMIHEVCGGALTAVDLEACEAVFHLPDAGQVPPSDRAAPLREALQLLAAPHDRWLTHAGAVGKEGRGTLLVGRGGTGKSTLAVACALAGMEIAADDYVMLEPGAPPIAHALQSAAKLTLDSSLRLGLADRVDVAALERLPTGEKAAIDLAVLAPGRLRRKLAIGALIAPVLGGEEEPRLEELPAARSLQALAPSTLLQSRAHSPALLAALAELARATPAFRLTLCPDAAANAAAVSEVVKSLG